MTDKEAIREWLELGDRFDAWKRNGIDPSDDDSYTPYMEACLDRWGDLLNFAKIAKKTQRPQSFLAIIVFSIK